MKVWVFMQEAVDEQGCVTPLLARMIDNKQRIYVGEDGPPHYLLNQDHAQKEKSKCQTKE
jgi:hypothetical protein